MGQYKFILSGGGTGGHIYPAIAIAYELKFRFPDAEFLFCRCQGQNGNAKSTASRFSN
jgi:UDP-N-acetylglucosamine--N-acetylmuramyl-(pentapeptide) pyrophosphoryl-undecaprenol N-acetylglucosamine transferase